MTTTPAPSTETIINVVDVGVQIFLTAAEKRAQRLKKEAETQAANEAKQVAIKSNPIADKAKKVAEKTKQIQPKKRKSEGKVVQSKKSLTTTTPGSRKKRKFEQDTITETILLSTEAAVDSIMHGLKDATRNVIDGDSEQPEINLQHTVESFHVSKDT